MACDLAQEMLREKPIDRRFLKSAQDVWAASFGMEDPAKEAAFVVRMKKAKRLKQTDSFNGLPLFKAAHTIFCEDHKGLVYFVKYIDVHFAAVPGRHIIQIAVWRRTAAPPGLARHIFWEHLFPIYGAIMTDAQQTAHGGMFWADRIQEAWDRNLFVYRVNLVQHSHTRLVHIKEYYQWANTVQGNKIGDQQEILLITDKPPMLG